VNERGEGFPVHVAPAEVVIIARPGDSVYAAARSAGYRWPTSCEGDGDCTVCWMEVIDGAGNLSPRTPIEERWLRNFAAARLLKGEARLACQAQVSGPVSVRKRGVRPDDGQGLSI
jgi:ferredoxin, 2Fe-2S